MKNRMMAAQPPNIHKISIESGLFGRISKLMRKQVIPAQWEILNDRSESARLDCGIENFSMACGDGDDESYPSHCIANFRIAAGEQEGEFYGMVFQDSDLAKWLEAVAYSLMTDPDEALEKQADDVIELIGKAQQADGYLNTYFTIKEPEKRWTNLCEGHELYCAGHMMEAAVAYYNATGKRALVDIMLKMAVCIGKTFGPDGKLPGYPGHEEIELALAKMYQATGDETLISLAKYFLDERGKKPFYFDEEFEKRSHDAHFWYLYPPYGMYSNGPKYEQYHLPVREQEAFEGHAVRCMYLASGMADVARETGDESLFDACKVLYKNMSERRMYITGGLGSTPDAEMFTLDYDLPNDLVYGETCASIGLVFFMHRMLLLEQDSRYADTMERALYNTCIAGMSLDGKHFFYVNPLEVDPKASQNNPNRKHVLPVRPEWFGCACCPPNLARLITSIGQYIYSIKDDRVFIHLYINNNAVLDVSGKPVNVRLETEYPYEGIVTIRPSKGRYSLCLRIPEWSMAKWRVLVNGQETDCVIENGYAVVNREWNDGDVLGLSLDMRVKRIYTHPEVSKDVGKVALQRGPLVYCLEGVDNGSGLQRVYLPRKALLEDAVNMDKLGGIVEIQTKGMRVTDYGREMLYHYDTPPEFEEIPLTFIPYYTWANRGENEMTVWVHEKGDEI